MTTKLISAQPADPYDAEAWAAFYAANPGWRRSVGAEGVNDDTNDDPKPGEGDPKPGEGDPKPKSGPSDKEAELLKDMMKQKEARKALEVKLAELEKKFEGVDLEEYQRIKQEQSEAAAAAAAAEEKRLLEAGEFETIKAQMLEQHNKAVEQVKAEADQLRAELDKSRLIIENLTVGAEFSTSKFITDETVFTSKTARKLYGDHFDVVDGKVIGFDKPRGAEGRSQIVDAAGNPAKFEDAMRRIIEADPEKDDILRAGMKPGGNSAPNDPGAAPKKPTKMTARDKISDGIVDLIKTIDKPSDSGLKL